MTSSCDVLVVGGGPSGLAAAIALRRQGVARVIVADREPEAGGIPRHSAHIGYGLRDLRRLMDGPRLRPSLRPLGRRGRSRDSYRDIPDRLVDAQSLAGYEPTGPRGHRGPCCCIGDRLSGTTASGPSHPRHPSRGSVHDRFAAAVREYLRASRRAAGPHCRSRACQLLGGAHPRPCRHQDRRHGHRPRRRPDLSPIASRYCRPAPGPVVDRSAGRGAVRGALAWRPSPSRISPRVLYERWSATRSCSPATGSRIRSSPALVGSS